ncbi:bifunctional ADP-dependent NAD(P)H-hydrate dehydratase/NAD(P)H-hydrate epimerase [Serratia microhaemolytica]|uniref:bifunctional ADP-dependent NAD(P)H-hydrate dehydratase/NAD(P)H-hydrate epimerase n=1 Tax=Serratia microhaemolytica TaxID=2675110 RepID=UPI000FDF58BE|nr:bifunctional ADP-dependent NAD(P)H-hydrate dehydratase/NAD(P)H-hydrate epimerase [Serratia microhaemolytica]
MRCHHQKPYCDTLPHTVWSARAISAAEPIAAAALGISLDTLMARAGSAGYQLARDHYPHCRHWLVLCGQGNNGGDGYVLARLAAEAGITVTLLACQQSRPLPAEAATARQAWLDAGGNIGQLEDHWPTAVDLIVDALLGTGLRAAPRAPFHSVIAAVNQSGCPVIALDIPSGLMADSGATPGAVMRATHTLTFIALKPGLLTGQARDWVGKLHFSALGLESWLNQQQRSLSMERIDQQQLTRWLQPRRPCAHKGEHGRLLLIGGDHGFGGAIRMAAEAALRSGAGLVRVLTRPEHVAPLLTARPELMVQGLTALSLQQGIDWADVVVIGPGLGQDEWGRQALSPLKNCDKPMLWDADALNLLALSPQQCHNRIITPHPGEAARLLGCQIAEIEADRLAAAQRLVASYGGVVVLKGAGSLVAEPGGMMSIVDVGNPGLAAGGSGDVLSGIIGGLLAQKLPLYAAACAGSVVHGAAADDVAAQQGCRGLLATDLLTLIPRYVNPAN